MREVYFTRYASPLDRDEVKMDLMLVNMKSDRYISSDFYY